MGFKAGTKRKITRAYDKGLEKRLTTLLPTFKKIAQDSVTDLDVFDTGETKKGTGAELDLGGNNRSINLYTRGVQNDLGEFYPKYPYFGLGSSRKYGPRPWLKLAASKIVAGLGLKQGNLPNANKTFKK